MKNSRSLRGIRFQTDIRNQQTSRTLYLDYRDMAVMFLKWILVLFLLTQSSFITCSTSNCYQALADCENDARCSVKLKEYAHECESIVDTYKVLTNSSTYPCSTSCVTAIKSLRQTEKGRALWKCDCRLDAHCISLKTRTEKCLAIANGTYRKRMGCTYAHYRCMIDPRCKDAQMDFLTKCAKIFTVTECTEQCLCSQKRLFGLTIGRPLMNCECDGSDELYCLGLRAHADHMKCSWKKIRRSRKKLKKRCKRCKQRKKGDKCGRREKPKRKD
jgi:hypothetical protein